MTNEQSPWKCKLNEDEIEYGRVLTILTISRFKITLQITNLSFCLFHRCYSSNHFFAKAETWWNSSQSQRSSKSILRPKYKNQRLAIYGFNGVAQQVRPYEPPKGI